MKDQRKTKAQLMEELAKLRQRIAEMEAESKAAETSHTPPSLSIHAAEEALRTSQERYKLATEAARVGVWDWNIETNEFYLDPNIKQILGYLDEEIPNDIEVWVTYVHPDDREPVMAAAQACIDGETPEYVFEHRMRHKDGSVRWIMVRGKVIRDSEARPIRMVGTDTDITQRRQLEENLQIELALQRLRNAILQMESETDWEQVVRNFHEELKEWIRFNACSINIIDLEEGTLISYAVGPKKGVHQNIRKTVEPNLLEALAATMETGRPWYRRNRQDPLFATRLPQEVNAVVDVPFLGGTVAINSTQENAFTQRDIEILEKFALVISQAFRRLEDLRALAQTEKRFQQAQKLEAVGQLAGGVAHDFNNLLTIISGYSQMLMLDLSGAHPAREEVEEIYNASQRGSALVRQLLAFSRRQVLHLEVLDLNALIADLEKMLHRLLGEDIALELKLAPSLSPVRADEGQLQQILMNLLINARDAMPDGGQLTLETADVELKEGHVREGVVVNAGPYVKLAVRDTGMGMDETTRARVFEPFFTTKESGKGTGLGLSTVYGIIKQSEGYVWVLSKPGQGATFEIYLPRTSETGSEPARPESRMSSQGTESILLVEDDDALRSVARRMLKHQGYQVWEASSGPEALGLASQTQDPIHLLLTDLIMPQMNGQELAQTLSAIRPKTKVLYMSGYAQGVADRHGALEPGTAFLQKPFTLESLSQKVREVLDTSGPQLKY